jgi:hypothetical protein
MRPHGPRLGGPEGERSRTGNGVLPAVHSPGLPVHPCTLRVHPCVLTVHIPWVRAPDHGRQQGEQAEAVEGGMVAGNGQAAAARPGHQPQRGLGRQVEAVGQGGGGQGFAVDDEGLRGRTRVPDLAVEAGPGHRDRPVESGQPVVESVDWIGRGGGGHHRPGGPPVGEAQQGQGVGRSRRRQPRTARYRRTSESGPPAPDPRALPRYSTVGEQTATRRATASRGRHHTRRCQCSANPSGWSV